MKQLSLFRNWDQYLPIGPGQIPDNALFLHTVYDDLFPRAGSKLPRDQQYVGNIRLYDVPGGSPDRLLADRWDRRRVIQIAILFQLIGEVLFLFISNYWLLVIVAVISGIGFAFSSGAQEAFIFDELKEKGREGEMNKVMARFNAAGYLGFITPPSPSAALLVQQASQNSIKIAILATAIAVGVGFLVTLTLKKSPVNEETHPTSQSTFILLKDGIKLIRRNKTLLRLAAFSVLSIVFWDYLSTLFQPYFQEIQVPDVLFGPTLAISSLVAFLTSKYVYKVEDRIGAAPQSFADHPGGGSDLYPAFH